MTVSRKAEGGWGRGACRYLVSSQIAARKGDSFFSMLQPVLRTQGCSPCRTSKSKQVVVRGSLPCNRKTCPHFRGQAQEWDAYYCDAVSLCPTQPCNQPNNPNNQHLQGSKVRRPTRTRGWGGGRQFSLSNDWQHVVRTNNPGRPAAGHARLSAVRGQSRRGLNEEPWLALASLQGHRIRTELSCHTTNTLCSSRLSNRPS